MFPQTRRAAGALAAGVLLAVPASAAAQSFGPDLGSAPLAPAQTCAQIGATVGQAVPSCMVSHIGTHPNTLTPPASGRVTAVRVRASAPGPMRVNVVRFLFQQTGDPARPSSAGPFLQAYGPQFTAAGGSVTAVPTDLPVQVDPTPRPEDRSTIQVIDTLALEVLAPDVPVPLFASPGVLTYPVLPGPTAAGVPAPSPNALTSYTTTGFGVLMNADLDRAAGGGGGGAPGAGAPAPGVAAPAPAAGAPARPAPAPADLATPRLRLPSGALRVRRGAVTIPIRCVGSDCAGTLTLLPAGARAAGRRVSYGSARFRASVGRSARVRVRLNRRGRSALRRRGRLRVTARAVFSGGAGRQTARLTLRR